MKKNTDPILISNYKRIQTGLYLDIETTGLSKDRSILSVIGCILVQEKEALLTQWFNDDAVSEEEMLKDFFRYLTELSHKKISLITFNGEVFDIPYLKKHFSFHSLSSDIFDCFSSIDLYKKLRPFQKAFQLEKGTQKDWEQLLGIAREDMYSGREMIKIYKDYLKTKENALRDFILLHNKDDLTGLMRLSSLYVFSDCFHLTWDVQEIQADENATLKVRCQMPYEFVIPLELRRNDFTVQFREKELLFWLPYRDSTMLHFFSNYQDYYYLPEEDRAIHKSIGYYVESKYRQKAKSSNCYIKKEGLFFELPTPIHKYGFYIKKEAYQDITLYRTSFEEKVSYIELDELFKNTNNQYAILNTYLKDWVKTLLIKES